MFIVHSLFFLNLLLISIFVIYHMFFYIYYLKLQFLEKGGGKETTCLSKINRIAILTPAHNEEAIIEKAVNSFMKVDYPDNKYKHFVIADNCTDKTAEIVQHFGTECLVRNDMTKKGKPYAINWALGKIDIDKYDAFTIIDADTTVSASYLMALNHAINMGHDSIQGYFGVMNPDTNWLTKLMVIPGILKFKIRYYSKERIGLSCPLMGNGMCFSKKIIKRYGWNAFSITENWEYFLMLMLKNIPTHYSEDAVIYSHAVVKLSHGEIQRKRWLRGKINLFKDYFERLLAKFIFEKNIKILDAIIELSIPSYSQLFSWSLLSLLIAVVFHYFVSGFLSMTLILLLFVVFQIIHFLSGLVIGKAPLKTWFMLPYIPIFLLWKMIITFKGVVGLSNNKWEKTERKL